MTSKKKVADKKFQDAMQADFIGRNMTDISQQARKAGWRISKTGNAAMRCGTKFHWEPTNDQ